MKNYLFVKLCILCTVSLVICLPSNRNEALNAIIENTMKRAEYEMSHKSMLVTKGEYEVWPELSSIEIQMNLCKKYIKKLFNGKTRLVVSFNNISVWIDYPITVNGNNKFSEPVPVAALCCEISPPAAHRKFIYFIQSRKEECLYLINRRTPTTQIFHIFDEICEYGTHNFWNIFRPRTLEANRKYKRQIRRSNDIVKQEEFENNHLKDYLLHKDEYLKWPHFREKNAEILCEKLLRKIFPRKNILIFNATNEVIELHYGIIQMTDEIVSSVTVSALKCHIPNRKRDGCFRFIKSPIQKCVHLIKHKTSNYSPYYISILLCDDDNASKSRGQPDLKDSEKQDELVTSFNEIKEEPQSGEVMKTECNEYESKHPSKANNVALYNFF